MPKGWTRARLLEMTLDAVEAMLPRNCRERLEELERQAGAGRARPPARKAKARKIGELAEAIRKASRLAARLGPGWHACGVGLAWAGLMASEAAKGLLPPLPAMPEPKPKKKKARGAEDPGQMRLWDALPA